jgi:trans-aconitate 2-methyltransferase
MAAPRWQRYFKGFNFRYGFHAPEDYRQWLFEAGLTPLRLELIPKDMLHAGEDGLKGWLRTTWMPFTEPVPQEQRDEFLDAVAARYLGAHPLDSEGNAHVKMIRLEVEAMRPN